MSSGKLFSVYEQLLALYGNQGWWPLIRHDGTNPTKSGSHTGYHPGDYSFPHSREEQFEIALGAILTQNTAWTNVEPALKNLLEASALHSPETLISLPEEDLRELIKPAGYFNQKCGYLRNMASFFISGDEVSRKSLLSIKGVGEETADAILLYAFNTPSFVIDAYTRRFLTYHNIIEGTEKYHTIQALFHNELPHTVSLFQEYHALFVEHGKRYFSKKPYKGDNGVTIKL